MSNRDWVEHISNFLIRTTGHSLRVSSFDEESYIISNESAGFYFYLNDVCTGEPLDNEEVRKRLYKEINKKLFS